MASKFWHPRLFKIYRFFFLKIGFKSTFPNAIITLHLNYHYFVKVIVTVEEIQAFCD